MHHCEYEQRFSIIEGKLTHCVVAMWKGYRLEVYRRDEEGVRTRNLYYNWMAGYVVEFPGEKTYGGTAMLEEWGEAMGRVRPFFGSKTPDEADQERVCSLYPDFKYIFRKCDLTYTEVMDLLPIWKEHPQVELLLANGWKRVAFSKAFYRLDKARMKKLLMAMRDHANEDRSVTEFRMISEGWDDELLQFAHPFGWEGKRPSVGMAKFMAGNRDEISVNEYADYVKMARKAGHDLDDPYWYAPADFAKRHQKVIRECKRIDRLNAKKEMERKQEAYSAAIRKMAGKVADVGALSVYVPETCREIQQHANRLHQCLVTADYIGKVAKGSCILVFITENGKPLATAELKPSRGRKFTIGQFYGDERKKDYLAPQRARDALDEWARRFKVKIAA